MKKERQGIGREDQKGLMVHKNARSNKPFASSTVQRNGRKHNWSSFFLPPSPPISIPLISFPLHSLVLQNWQNQTKKRQGLKGEAIVRNIRKKAKRRKRRRMMADSRKINYRHITNYSSVNLRWEMEMVNERILLLFHKLLTLKSSLLLEVF